MASNDAKPRADLAVTETHAIAAGKTIRLVPIHIFGLHCDHDDHRGEPIPFAYGICDAVQAWSDCNRAIGRIYRVDEDRSIRRPEDTITVWASEENLDKLGRDWSEHTYEDTPPTDLGALVKSLRAQVDRLTEERDAARDASQQAADERDATLEELESIRVLLWPDGEARKVPMDRREGFATAVEWLLRQRVTLTEAFHGAEAERDAWLPLFAEVLHWRDACEVFKANHDRLIAAVDAYTEGTKP